MSYSCLSGKKYFIAFLACAAMILISAFQASARYDPALTWCTIQTDNFIIYYPEGHELLAQRVLSLCEKVHKDITGYLGVEPRPARLSLIPALISLTGSWMYFPAGYPCLKLRFIPCGGSVRTPTLWISCLPMNIRTMCILQPGSDGMEN